MKGLRMIGEGMHGFVGNDHTKFDNLDEELSNPTDLRIFAIAQALEEGYTIERIEERYRKLLKNVKDKLVFSRDGDCIWQCSNCGHIVVGKEAPEVCPVCNHPQSYFQIEAKNY